MTTDAKWDIGLGDAIPDEPAGPSSDFFETPNSDPDDAIAGVTYDEPAIGIASEKKRSRKAVAYERKVSGVFNTGFRIALNTSATVPDAAALSMHVAPISRAYGDLADADPRFARMIDFVTDGTENPYATAVVATMPLLLQILRNHEPVIEPKDRGIKIPFGKRKGERITVKFGIRLRGIRALTNDPQELAKFVFDDPRIADALEKQGLKVAKYGTAAR